MVYNIWPHGLSIQREDGLRQSIPRIKNSRTIKGKIITQFLYHKNPVTNIKQGY